MPERKEVQGISRGLVALSSNTSFKFVFLALICQECRLCQLFVLDTQVIFCQQKQRKEAWLDVGNIFVLKEQRASSLQPTFLSPTTSHLLPLLLRFYFLVFCYIFPFFFSIAFHTFLISLLFLLHHSFPSPTPFYFSCQSSPFIC